MTFLRREEYQGNRSPVPSVLLRNFLIELKKQSFQQDESRTNGLSNTTITPVSSFPVSTSFCSWFFSCLCKGRTRACWWKVVTESSAVVSWSPPSLDVPSASWHAPPVVSVHVLSNGPAPAYAGPIVWLVDALHWTHLAVFHSRKLTDIDRKDVVLRLS